MLPDTLRAIRNMRGMTQQQVAEKLGVDRSTYTYYETGKSNVDVNTLLRLASIFNASYKDLLEGNAKASDSLKCTEAYQTLTSEEKDLIDKYRSLKVFQRKKVVAEIEKIIKNKE